MIGAVFAGTIVVPACGSSDASALSTSDGGISDSGAADGPATPEKCDLTADLKDAPRCVVDSYGVFVDATNGHDTSAGTMAAPVQTITAALSKLAGKARLYVCAGSYAEYVKLTLVLPRFCGHQRWPAMS